MTSSFSIFLSAKPNNLLFSKHRLLKTKTFDTLNQIFFWFDPNSLCPMNENLSNRELQINHIFSTIATSIKAGAWKEGEKLPTERELAIKYGVSRAVVKQAIQDLEHKGLLDRMPNCRPTIRRKTQGHTMHAKSGRNQIGVWIPQSLEAPGAAAILQGIREALAKFNYSVVMGCPVGPNDLSELPFLKTLQQTTSIAGAIILPSGMDTAGAYDKLFETGYPLVFVDRDPCANRKFDLVGTNNVQAAKQAVQHLLKLGHRRVAMVGNTDDASSVRDRYDGYCLAMLEAGLRPYPLSENTIPSGIGSDASEQAIAIIKKLQHKIDQPTALFCVNDQAALHLNDAASLLGWTVPHDLSLMGFDWSLRWVPSGGHLTTICQHFDVIGQVAVGHLLEKIDDAKAQVPRQILVEGTLVERGSAVALDQSISHKNITRSI